MTEAMLTVRVRPITHDQFVSMGIHVPQQMKLLKDGGTFTVERKKFHPKAKKWMYELRCPYPSGKMHHLWVWEDYIQEI